MKVMKKLVTYAFASIFALSACGSKTQTVNNYYDDGLYSEPGYAENTPASQQNDFSLEDVDPDSKSAEELDYYDPNDNSSTNQSLAGNGTTVINNYYSPSYRNPGWNNNYYWNGYGWNNWAFNNYYYDPFFDPYYCSAWGPSWGFRWGYSSWGWRSRWGWND